MPIVAGEKLTRLASVGGMSVNELLEELSTAALAAYDVEGRFRLGASFADHAAAVKAPHRVDRNLARPD